MVKLVKTELENYLKMRKQEIVKHNFGMELNLANKVFDGQLEKTIDEFSSTENIDGVYKSILDGELNPSYKQRSVVLLKKFVQFLHFSNEKEEQLLRIIRPYTPNRDRSTRKRILTQKEYELLLAKTKNPMDKVFIKMLYYYGIGIEDLTTIKWESISLTEKTIKITPHWRKKVLTDINATTTFKIPDDLLADLIDFRNVGYRSEWLFTSLFFKSKHVEQKALKNRLRKYGWMIGVEEDIDAYAITQIRLINRLKSLINQDVMNELKQTYNLNDTQIIRKYLSVMGGGDKDAV